MTQQTMPYLKLIALDKLREGDWDPDELMAAGGFVIRDPGDPNKSLGGLFMRKSHSFKITTKDDVPSIEMKRKSDTDGGFGMTFTASAENIASFPSAGSLYMGLRFTSTVRLVDVIIATAYTGSQTWLYRTTLEPGVSYYIELGVSLTDNNPTPIVHVNGKVISGTASSSSIPPTYSISLRPTTGQASVGEVCYCSDPYIHISHKSRQTGFLGDVDIRTSDMTLVNGGGWSTSSGESELEPIDVINGVKTGATTPSIALSKTGSVSSIKCDITRIGESPDLMGACLNITTFRDPSSGYSTHVQMGCTYQNITQPFVETARLTPADKFSPVVSQNISMSIVNRGYILGSTAQVNPKIIDVSIKSIKV